jgi:hypothetical protein
MVGYYGTKGEDCVHDRRIAAGTRTLRVGTSCFRAYPSPVDVIRVGLELLREQELIDGYPQDELRREIRIGITEADRGDVPPFDPIAALAELELNRSES